MTPERGMHPLGVGAALGDRYRLERRIATGGMATIWLGRDRKLSRPVAVKILSDVLAEDPAYVARFRREARLAAGLSHANLVQVYDFSGESERPYLVMEYVGEGTLADRIEAGRPGGVDARRLAHELLGALDCIHGAGVVHRDVKPSNVLIDRECRARLTDFGIAQTADATRITRTGEVVGTLTYMAPEVRAGSPATERSDLYSLGVLLDECRAGDIGPQVARLVERLVQADPAERPASARHALTLLETAPEPAPRAAPAAMPPSARRSRVVELNGRRVATVVAALGLAAILVAVAIGGGQSGTDRARTGEVQPRRSTTTTTTTSVVTTTSTVAPTPAAAPKPEPKSPGEKPPKPEGTQPKGEKVPPGQEKRGGD